jgi:hypothetical protein
MAGSHAVLTAASIRAVFWDSVLGFADRYGSRASLIVVMLAQVRDPVVSEAWKFFGEANGSPAWRRCRRGSGPARIR